MKIHDETEDRLIFVDSKDEKFLIFFGLLSISTFFWIFDSILLAFFFRIFGVGLVLFGFYLLLIDSKFVIEKKTKQ